MLEWLHGAAGGFSVRRTRICRDRELRCAWNHSTSYMGCGHLKVSASAQMPGIFWADHPDLIGSCVESPCLRCPRALALRSSAVMPLSASLRRTFKQVVSSMPIPCALRCGLQEEAQLCLWPDKPVAFSAPS